MRALSDEYTKFKFNGKCPSCSNRHLINFMKQLGSWKLFDGKGQPLSMFTPMWRLPQGAHMVCQNCSYKITVFEVDKLPKEEAVELVNLVETHRSEERIGRDERLIDNSSGPAAVTRRLLLTREWSRDCKLDQESSERSTEGFTLGGQDSTHFSLETERLLKQRYSITEGSREVFTEEVTLTVPPGVRLRVIIDWKNLWQHGVINARRGNDRVSYRFQVLAGLTFDQTQSAV